MSEVVAIVLAAGAASRYRAAGGREPSKLVAPFHGEPLVRAAVKAARAAGLAVIVVTGHAREAVEAALAGLDAVLVENRDFATGLASSLKAGVAALPPSADGAFVLLGDMPLISPQVLERLASAFAARPDVLAAIPVFAGERGNPVLLARAIFPEVAKLEGDEGARRLLKGLDPGRIAEVEFGDQAVALDVDTPSDLARAAASGDNGATDPFAAMFRDIGQDYEAALSRVETDADGARHWRDVAFAPTPGFRPLTLYVSVPPASAPPPLVIFIHGGGWMMGHPTVGNAVYARLDPIGKLLRAGFAAARISYRFSSEAKFPAQLHDCKAAVRFLRNRSALFGVDPNRFAAMGDSAGGHLAALVGLTGDRADLEGDVGDLAGSSAVQAVIDWFGPAELLTMREQALPDGMKGQDEARSPESRLVGGPLQQFRAEAIAASPISYVTRSAPPFHIQHGTRDRLVPPAQSEALHGALIAAGGDSTLVAVEGADHCFWGVPGEGIVERDIAFLREKLGR